MKILTLVWLVAMVLEEVMPAPCGRTGSSGGGNSGGGGTPTNVIVLPVPAQTTPTAQQAQPIPMNIPVQGRRKRNVESPPPNHNKQEMNASPESGKGHGHLKMGTSTVPINKESGQIIHELNKDHSSGLSTTYDPAGSKTSYKLGANSEHEGQLVALTRHQAHTSNERTSNIASKHDMHLHKSGENQFRSESKDKRSQEDVSVLHLADHQQKANKASSGHQGLEFATKEGTLSKQKSSDNHENLQHGGKQSSSSSRNGASSSEHSALERKDDGRTGGIGLKQHSQQESEHGHAITSGKHQHQHHGVVQSEDKAVGQSYTSGHKSNQDNLKNTFSQTHPESEHGQELTSGKHYGNVESVGKAVGQAHTSGHKSNQDQLKKSFSQMDEAHHRSKTKSAWHADQGSKTADQVAKAGSSSKELSSATQQYETVKKAAAKQADVGTKVASSGHKKGTHAEHQLSEQGAIVRDLKTPHGGAKGKVSVNMRKK